MLRTLAVDGYRSLRRLVVPLAAATSQLIVVSHSAPLVTELTAQGALAHELSKRGGETVLTGQGALDEPAWHWPSR